MSAKLEELNDDRRLWVVVILHHRYQLSEVDLSRSPRCGWILDQLVRLGPAQTQENRLLFPFVCNVVSQEKVLQSVEVFHPPQLGECADGNHHSKLRANFFFDSQRCLLGVNLWLIYIFL